MTTKPRPTDLNHDQRVTCAVAARKMRNELLKMQHALERDNDLSATEARTSYDAARGYWTFLSKHLTPKGN